jgi:hypothetical protein
MKKFGFFLKIKIYLTIEKAGHLKITFKELEQQFEARAIYLKF